MSSEARPPIFRMAREDVWEFTRPNMDLVPELIKYSAIVLIQLLSLCERCGY